MIAFVFPGQGAQKVGMGRSLAEAFPICRDTFAEADAALGEPLSTLCFDGPDDRLMLTENTQPAILAMSTAVARLAVSRGIQPAFAAGHSLGEYSAHVAAGTLSFADALRTVKRRGRYMQEAVPVGDGRDGGHSRARRRRCREGLRRGGRRAGRLAGEPQCSRTDRDCRPRAGRGPRRRARQGARRQARDSARGQRAVPLRADEAGRGSPGARAARAGVARPGVPGRRQRRRGAEDDRRATRSRRSSARCRRRCAGKMSCAVSIADGRDDVRRAGAGHRCSPA